MPNYELPEYINKRVRYFDGQFLTDRDFVDEQNYHLDRRQRQNRLLRSPGILDGLEVAETSDSTGIKITPGTAVDYQGRLIILHDIVDFEGEPLERQGKAFVLSTENYADKQVTLYLSYSQQEADQATPDAQSGDAARGSAGYTRWLEQPLNLLKTEVLLQMKRQSQLVERSRLIQMAALVSREESAKQILILLFDLVKMPSL